MTEWQTCSIAAEWRCYKMLLLPEKSLCEKNQAIVVSKDSGARVEHRALNPKRRFELRHYKLDGELIQQTTCCDFLLINDSRKKAYFIELKGSNIDEAVKQLEAGERICRVELKGYAFLYRIVCSNAKTHKIRNLKYRKFKEKCGSRLEMKERRLEEILE